MKNGIKALILGCIMNNNCENCAFDSETKVIPFSNGTDAMVWQDNNCLKCRNYESESHEEEEAKCKMAYNLDLGFITGSIPLRIAKDIGCDYNPLYKTVNLFTRCRKFSDKNKPEMPF